MLYIHMHNNYLKDKFTVLFLIDYLIVSGEQFYVFCTL